MRKIFHYTKKVLVAFILLVVIYLLLALAGTLLPANFTSENKQGEIPIFVESNDFHTNIIVPLQNEHLDWFAKIDTTKDTLPFDKYRNYQYISLGWGDEGFFMGFLDNQSPSMLTTINAAFLPTKSLMHIIFYEHGITTSENTIKLFVSKEQLKNLIDFLENSFQQSENQKFIFHHQGYNDDDYFFKAKDSYHLLNTCNVWTNNALREADLPASLWSPFAQGVMWRLREK